MVFLTTFKNFIFGKTKRRCCNNVPAAISHTNKPTQKNQYWREPKCAMRAKPLAQIISPILLTASCTPVISDL